MKTTVKQLATGTFLALLLLVGNVNAEGTERKNFGHKRIETTLQLEKWMTDATLWNTNSEVFADLVQAKEKESNLEAWMTSENTWNSNLNFETETEAGLELENWMINDANWKVNQLSQDSNFKVESWMVNENYWK